MYRGSADAAATASVMPAPEQSSHPDTQTTSQMQQADNVSVASRTDAPNETTSQFLRRMQAHSVRQVGGASTIGATSTIGGTFDREEPGGIAAVAERAWQKRMKPPNFAPFVTVPRTVCM